MKFTPLTIPDVILVEPRVFGDERGFFMESWNQKEFEKNGITTDFVQDNHSCSSSGVLRGLHFQEQQTQGKLVRVTSGSVFDVVVDIREDSDTTGQHVSMILSAENKKMLWIPPGFAHGFLTLEDHTEFLYKCTDFYAPEFEKSILWSDPDLNIHWPEGFEQPELSAKDRDAPMFKDVALLKIP